MMCDLLLIFSWQLDGELGFSRLVLPALVWERNWLPTVSSPLGGKIFFIEIIYSSAFEYEFESCYVLHARNIFKYEPT